MAQDWVWVLPAAGLAIYAEQMTEHGGGGDGACATWGFSKAPWPGRRTLPSMKNRTSRRSPLPMRLASRRNHPFVDGNKRTAAVVSETFLMLNGYRLGATDAELVVAILALAAGDLSEADLADWFRAHITPA